MGKVKYTVDRFEGDFANLLLRGDEAIQIDVPRHQLPDGVKEGDILEVQSDSNNGVVKVTILKEETDDARKKVSDLIEKLKNKK